MKMTVSLDKLSLSPNQSKPAPPKTRQAITLDRAATAKHEINLIQLRAEEAQHALESFLDDAILGRLPFVRIVHGKGEGILRKVVREALSQCPSVQNVREAEAHEGGAGVTIATFG
jgi:DNA mismatch repair protein MutS2